MTEHAQKLTKTDIDIGAIYYAILIELARAGGIISYGELVATAKAAHPDNESVQKAIAVSAGRRLDAVRTFTNEKGYPDITSLVVNAGTGEVGSAFGSDPVARRAEVTAFDWSTVQAQFALFIDERQAELPVRRVKVKRPQAAAAVWEYYVEHKAILPAGIVTHRERLVGMVMGGLAVADAFEDVAAASSVPDASTAR